MFQFNQAPAEPKTSEPSLSSFDALFTPSAASAAAKEPDEPDEPEEPADPDDAYIPGDESFNEHSEPTIFSFMPRDTEPQLSFGTDEPEPEEPEEPSGFSFNLPEDKPAPSAGIFAGLSSSFLKDLEEDAGSNDAPQEEPSQEAPVQPRSQLAVQADKSGLIVDGRSKETVRTPSFTGADADIAVRWSNLTSELKNSNGNIAVILEHTKLRKEGDSAYIVFEDRDERLLSNLKKSQAFRQISSGIKDKFGAAHLYICTQRMYTEQMRKNQASELDKRLDDLNERSKNMGVPTDVHFGD
jgi:hypothetical protein